MKAGLGVEGGVGRDQGQAVGVSELDQARLGGFLGRDSAAAQFDVEAVGEQLGEVVGIGARLGVLAIGEQPRERPLGAGGERDQPVGHPGQRVERDVRVFGDRAVEMRATDELAQIGVARLVLREQHQPVEHPGGPDTGGARDAQRRANDRLDPLVETGVAERHRRVEPVAVGQRGGGEAQVRGVLGDRLGLDRALEHGEAGKDAQRDVGAGHCGTMGIAGPNRQRSCATYPQFIGPP